MNAAHFKLAALLLAAALGGCGPDRAEHESGERHGAGEGELFEKNKGVRLPQELQRELGLATVEVVEKSVTPRVEKLAQVYRAAGALTPAGAVVWLNSIESQDVRVGQSVHVRLPASSDAIATGTVVQIERSSKVGPEQVEALIEFNDAEGRFPMRAFVMALFSSGSSHSALAVPESAVVQGAGGSFVYAASGEHFVRTPVKTGTSASGWVEITDGLYVGDIVAAKAVGSLWLVELCALKGGSPCCPVPVKKRDE